MKIHQINFEGERLQVRTPNDENIAHIAIGMALGLEPDATGDHLAALALRFWAHAEALALFEGNKHICADDRIAKAAVKHLVDHRLTLTRRRCPSDENAAPK